MSIDPFDPRTWTDAAPWRTITISPCGEVCALVDACDYDNLRQLNQWCMKPNPTTIYVRCYINTPDKRNAVFMHNVVMELAGIKPPTKRHKIVDHRNGNGLDCRRFNLRWATRSQNRRNIVGSAERERLIKEGIELCHQQLNTWG